MKKTNLLRYGLLLVIVTAIGWLSFSLFGPKEVPVVVSGHPVDSIAEPFRMPYYRANMLIECVRSVNVRRALNLDQGAVDAIDGELEELDRRQVVVWHEWRSNHPDRRGFEPFEPPELQELLVATKGAILKTLDERQQRRLKAEVYHRYGPNVLFLPEVQRELNMTSEQRELFKDRYAASIREAMSFDEGRRSPPQGIQVSVHEYHMKRVREMDRRLLTVLSPRQQFRLSAITGRDVFSQ